MVSPHDAPQPNTPVSGGTAVGYLYLSTTVQAPENGTLEAQRGMIERYAREHGLTLQTVIEETSESLSSRRQPRLERLIQGEWGLDWDVLLVARLDRLTRQVRSLNAILSRLQNQPQRHLISIEEGLDTRTAAGQFCVSLVGYFSAWDGAVIPDRTREWIARKRQKGEPIGHAPYGFTYQDKKLVVSPGEMQVIQTIRDLRAQQLSYEKIARYLNGQKIPSKRGGGWYPETVKSAYSRAATMTALGAD